MYTIFEAIGVIFLILIVFVLWQQRKITKLNQQNDDLKKASDSLVKPGMNIIQSATQKANEIISQAEMQALKIPSQANIDKSALEEQLNNKLGELLIKFNVNTESIFKHFEDNLSISLAQDKKKHDDFLEMLSKRSLDFQLLVQNSAKSTVESTLINFEEKMTDFLSSAQQRSNDAINLEISSARQLIDSYKTQQLTIVDENIIAVLERTLSIVLNQKLTLRDQLDLVYEALEKAKLEKFLV